MKIHTWDLIVVLCTNENFKPNENHSMHKMAMIPNEILMFGVGEQSKLL
jgi:hypothetical protein